ncbi:MAG: ABC transporter permease subunit [Tissierellia bacterium]|nr:ABC transporter permease subunit [Tissierellia bacterium]
MNKFKISNLILYLMLFIIFMPLLILIIWSFAKNWPWPYIFPKSMGLRGWEYLFDNKTKSATILIRSILISLIVTVFVFILTIPSSKALAFGDFKAKKYIELLFFSPMIIPSISIAMGIHIQFIRLGLAGRYSGVVLIQALPCIPYAIRILKTGFEIMGRDIEYQAKVLGANNFQTFIHISLPLLYPSILTSGSLVFIVSFSQYFLTALIGSGKIKTFPMLMIPLIQSGDRNTGSVFSISFVIIALAVLMISESLLKIYYKKRFGEINNVIDKN